MVVISNSLFGKEVVERSVNLLLVISCSTAQMAFSSATLVLCLQTEIISSIFLIY